MEVSSYSPAILKRVERNRNDEKETERDQLAFLSPTLSAETHIPHPIQRTLNLLIPDPLIPNPVNIARNPGSFNFFPCSTDAQRAGLGSSRSILRTTCLLNSDSFRQVSSHCPFDSSVNFRSFRFLSRSFHSDPCK